MLVDFVDPLIRNDRRRDYERARARYGRYFGVTRQTNESLARTRVVTARDVHPELAQYALVNAFGHFFDARCDQLYKFVRLVAAHAAEHGRFSDDDILLGLVLDAFQVCEFAHSLVYDDACEYFEGFAQTHLVGEYAPGERLLLYGHLCGEHAKVFVQIDRLRVFVHDFCVQRVQELFGSVLLLIAKKYIISLFHSSFKNGTVRENRPFEKVLKKYRDCLYF